MKIKRLDIEGFRSLRKVSWFPGDLNVVIGPNGSGKSNLLQFLELISVSAQGRLGKYIQSLGGMDAIVWDGRATSIRFGLDMSPIDEKYKLEHYELEMIRLGNGSSYEINQELLTGIGQFIFVKRKLKKYKIYSDLLESLTGSEFLSKENIIDVPVSQINDEESIFHIAPFHFETSSGILFFGKSLSSISIYHDIRTDKDAPIRQATVTRFEKRVESDGQNLISVLHTLYTGDRDFKADINAAMKAAFGDDFEELVFPPASDQRIQLRVRWKSLKREQSAADLSDGTLRFLFLLTILASPVPPPLIAIDEPETGLHPSMLPIIAEFAQDAAMRSQVIFTTHSPQFLDAFSEAQPTTTVALWENGETILRTLPQDELEYWLKGYSLGALYRSGTLEQMG